jgi:ankyrin repeat protein
MTLESYKLGRTPLHIAAGRGASIDVIQLLIRMRPEAVHEKDSWGKTPFACACAAVTEFQDPDNYSYVSELLRLLKDNKTISDPDRSGMLPLHIACSSGMNIDNIEYLLDEYPEAICTPDNNGRLPFHAACTRSSTSIEVLELLAAAFPEALRTFDKQGAVPLHIALQRKLPSDIILFLIDKEVGAVRTREASTLMYPLHIAARAGADPIVLDEIAAIYPQAIDTVDSKGNTIFHVACTFRQISIDFATHLLDKCDPDTVRKVNDDQSLPLHVAVQHRASWPVLQLLIDLYPEALLLKDKKGNIPLHLAFQTNTEMPVLVRLAQQNHRQFNKKNSRGFTPTKCASPTIQLSFRRARYWYNLRKAYCPICIRYKYDGKKDNVDVVGN